MNFTSKDNIRKEIISKRNNIDYKLKAIIDKNIQKQLIEYIKEHVNQYSKISIYYPMRSEVNLIKITNMPDFEFSLPVVFPGSKLLKFYPWRSSDQLKISSYSKSIYEPENQINEVVPDIIVAPLVACDPSGNRIGYGGGFYDATILQLKILNPKIIYIGVCYKFQVLEEIPIEPHDIKLDKIIHET